MPEAKPAQGEMQMGQATPQPSVPVMTVLSFLTLAAGLVLAWLFGAM
jgi:membrane protein insertase Oxa1/YidC/SpoIIIJ